MAVLVKGARGGLPRYKGRREKVRIAIQLDTVNRDLSKRIGLGVLGLNISYMVSLFSHC